MRSHLPILVLALFAAAVSAAESKPLLRDFMGINGHFTFKPELYRQVCRLVRNYHNLNWDVAKPGDLVHPPLCVNKVDWKRNVYGPWKAAGFETDICLQASGFDAANKDYRALWAGQEQWCFDYGKAVASFYGPSGSEKLCTAFEIGNEPGSAFDAALYKTIFAQMAKGLRAGDPKVKILTPTVQARAGDAYAQDLRLMYADTAMLPLYDGINIHTYAGAPRSDKLPCPWTRSYPEDPAIDYLQVVDEVIAWRNQQAKGKEVWITEFGYDACTPAAMAKRKEWFLKLDWQGTTDLQQAQYLVRSFLVFAERDVDRAYLYFYDDKDEPSTHASAGLTRGFQPKMSFWAVRQLYRTLGDYRFSRVVKKDAGSAYVYEFIHGSERGQVVWVAWSPTGVRTDSKTGYVPRESTITLSGLPALPKQVVGMATADGEAPKPAWTKTGERTISLTVGEAPIYLLMAATPSR